MNDHHEGIVAVELYKEALRIKEMRRHRNYDLIPSLSVIKEGALKGFVPVSVKYSGFTYDNYLFASNFAYTKDKNGNIIKDKIKPIYKNNLSNFDLSDFEKVDSQLFSTVSQPMCWFKYNQMYFNRACIDKMKNTQYIELLFEPTEKLLAIRSCNEYDDYAIKWGVEKNDKLSPITKTSSGISHVLFDCMEWNEDYRYKMIGVRRTKNNDSIVIFDLNNAEAICREELESENPDEVISKITSYYDEYLSEHFGNNFYDDIYTMRLYMMDILKKWNLGAELVPIENPKEWLIEAKKCVEEQVLSIDDELTGPQKESVVDSLCLGNTLFPLHPKKQSEKSYSLMRKFGLILLKDIKQNKSSIVFKAFEKQLLEVCNNNEILLKLYSTIDIKKTKLEVIKKAIISRKLNS